MDFGAVVESVLKIGLAPTLLIIVLYWNKETMDKRISHLEDENKRLLDIIDKKLLK